MPIITSYPLKTPTDDDYVLGVKKVDGKQTTALFQVSSINELNKVVNVTLTSAQLLALSGGGTIELVEAPGANKLVVPISLAAFLDFNATAYNFSDPVNVSIGDNEPNEDTIYEIPTSFLNDNEDRYGVFNIQDINYTTGLEPNVALNLIVPGTETVTTGDSPLTLSIMYRIVDFS